MEIIDRFFDNLSIDCEEAKNSVWEKAQIFFDKMSSHYSIDKVTLEETNATTANEIDEQISGAGEKSDSGEYADETSQSMRITTNLEFDSIVTIAGYLDQRYRDVDILINFVENSELYGRSYQKNLSNFSEEIFELKEKIVKDFKKKDRDELIDGFVSKFLKIIRTNLFETVYDNIYRYSLTSSDDSSILGFKKLIDEFMEKAGFDKRDVLEGEQFNSKVCSSENPEYTNNPALHKMIKSVIWQPYVLSYYSYAESKQVKKIIKGKVICYSSKI